MTRLIIFPNESAQVTLDSSIPASELVQAINNGKWQPPGQAGDIPLGIRLQAVRLGRSTVLAYLPNEPANAAGSAARSVTLTPRQLAILQCLAEGLTVQQVSLRLGLSRRTVFLHLAAIRRNLNAVTTQEALLRAAALGLCRLPPRQ